MSVSGRTTVAASLLLFACSPVETKLLTVQSTCLSRGLDLQGVKTAAGGGDEVGNEAGLPEIADHQPRPDVRLLPTGRFVVDFGTVTLVKPAFKFRLRCTGDFNAGTIETIQVDDVIRRPPPGTRWTF